MSSILEIPEVKNKCQILTPISTVATMLDIAGYKKHLFGKKVLENSFGSGNILLEIVIRYIRSCIKDKLSAEKIAIGLSEDIYGIELDKDLFRKCRTALNQIIKSYNLPPVKWKLYNKNALEWHPDIYFDYIIGNPPYITYKELDDETRKTIKETYDSCSDGKFDYYYAFIEAGLRSLNSTGKLVQLVPNNIYKNVFAHKLRCLLRENVSIIIDYPAQKIFKDVMTSSSIFVYDKSFADNLITYKNETEKSELKIPRNLLDGKWQFDKKIKITSDLVYFGELFTASIAIATLLNEAFIVDDKIIDEYKIESKVLRKAVSPRSLRYKKMKQLYFLTFI
ncbi:N-6 DNA methylase [Brucepastera parasyntrophica]|uniref:Eco57I restriction-modification methylase domain-containing protein n=1 Tax=Brucepastera parasyntrophica TaxID=2880008 RepID=UPI00210D1396|nr:N-6 DNA methylase [Brucepastera parasyntrophica]ULQ60413.1 N-6 DNA methylase [Brucepastera parasyntrophica]